MSKNELTKIPHTHAKPILDTLVIQIEKLNKGEIEINTAKAISKNIDQVLGIYKVGVALEKNQIEKEKLQLERDKFESSKDDHPLSNQNKLMPKIKERNNGYWSLYTIKQHLIQYIQTSNYPIGKMPKGKELEKAGPQYEPLVNAIIDHGGFKEVAEKLGLKFDNESVTKTVTKPSLGYLEGQ